jgi:exonuclease VII small subunit
LIIRKLAGYNSDNKLYYNTRTIVMPDEALLRMTPIGKWCYDAYAAVLEEDPEGEHQTALHVLRFFCELNTVFVQDMAAIIALHQDRQNHHLYAHMEMFESVEWKAFLEKMKEALEKEDNPLDANLEKVLPGVHLRLHLQERLTQDLVNKVDNVDSKIDKLSTTIVDGFQGMDKSSELLQASSDRRLAGTFMRIAQQLLASSNVSAPSNLDTIMEDTSMEDAQELPLLPRMELFTEVMQEQECGSNDASIHSNYRSQTKYNSLCEVWNQWYGIDQHGDVYGGISGRNDQFGAKWRKHLDKQQYSRINRIIKAVSDAAEKEIALDEALNELEETYSTCNRNLQKFADLMQSNGYLPKGACRGRKVATANQ